MRWITENARKGLMNNFVFYRRVFDLYLNKLEIFH